MEGLLGGRSAGPARYTIAGKVITKTEGLTQLAELRKSTDVVILEAAGGSGFGDPRERPLELVQRDLTEGYITPKGLAAYGARLRNGEVVRSPMERRAKTKRRR
jgi:N-methylhydantoinase B/oxoprolinase/acetone carboxylase alpha subunit